MFVRSSLGAFNRTDAWSGLNVSWRRMRAGEEGGKQWRNRRNRKGSEGQKGRDRHVSASD